MNEELMKVIAGLECCTGGKIKCYTCPYDNGRWDVHCMDKLMTEALHILKEVERDGIV